MDLFVRAVPDPTITVEVFTASRIIVGVGIALLYVIGIRANLCLARLFRNADRLGPFDRVTQIALPSLRIVTALMFLGIRAVEWFVPAARWERNVGEILVAICLYWDTQAIPRWLTGSAIAKE